MDTSLLVRNLSIIAQAALPMLPFGQVGMVAARAALDALRMAIETMALSQDQIAALEGDRNALELAVNEHAKLVAAKLAG